jgi:hypothetical protein
LARNGSCRHAAKRLLGFEHGRSSCKGPGGTCDQLPCHTESPAARPSTTTRERTLNLTLGSGFAALVAAGVTIFNKSFKSIFGDSITGVDLANTKATILVAVIAAFAAIAVADLLTRAWATAAKARVDSFTIAAAPSKLKAKKTSGVDETGFIVAALRFKPSAPDEVEYLLVKTGAQPEWVARKDLELSAA